jgi:putative intracellular protease/amidase
MMTGIYHKLYSILIFSIKLEGYYMKAYLYILDTLADWEIGNFTAEWNSGRYLDKSKPVVPIIRVGASNAPIKTMGGMMITPDVNIDNVKFEKGDLLVLPGADTWMDNEHKMMISLVEPLLEKNVTVAAICGATMALAQHGILDNRKHTSNASGFLSMMCPAYRGEQNFIDRGAVTDNNLITASVFAPVEFAYEIFRKTGVMKPATVEAWFMLFTTREIRYFYALMESLK